jgi:plastocyanin
MAIRLRRGFGGQGRFPRVICAALVAAAIAACGGSEPAQQSAAPKAAAEPVDPATAGNVTGRIVLVGTPPPNQPIKTKSDPNCKAPIATESFAVGKEGALGNVFVYVKDGLGNRVFPVPSTPVTLGQKDCTYQPHVLGIQVGQTLAIVSHDPTLHNVHAVPRSNQEFNVGQPDPSVRNQHVFSTAEVLVPFKCDVHNWMQAFVGVVDHPYYAVTATDGAFSLKGLPPGTYTIEAVHEKLGRQTQSVTIGEKETKDVAFTFTI